ncbi:testis-specific gene A8 protein-like [Epinephelus fuscoguttatus]|uniref:testis-specific gene A8 protein-like n=1 Tax=Epinephelus fuscoguttatus TaxID=293821 RepID=UPI0020D1B084|nr:testis-specific gene A8 protein-like [Epinephelus fuscoguttatus]
MHGDVEPQLVKADKKISDLKEDIRQLSGELNNKSSMLTVLQEVAHEQSLQIASLTAALQDTVHLDPSAWPPLSSSSTQSHRWSWVEVVGRGKRAPGCAASPPRLSLSNRYSALASDGDPDAGTADNAAAAASPPTGAAPAAPHLEESASASNGAVAPSPPAGGTPAAPCMDGSASSSLAPVVDRSAAAAGPNHRLPCRASASATRRRPLKGAV